MPAPWYLLVGAPADPSRPSRQERPSRQQENATTTMNSNPDRGLIKRFKEGNFASISAMMEGKDVTISKHANKDVCLVWALKGECSAGCKQKALHVCYSQATNRAIGEMMTKCGVPEIQA